MKKRLAMICLFSAALLIPIPCRVHGSIPDTGQTLCYDNTAVIPCPFPGEPFYGQDAHYAIHTPSFTKLGADGGDLPDTAVSWVMIRDNVTGLIWEIKQNRDRLPDYANPHDADNEYTWYNPDPLTNGGSSGTPGDGTDTRDFIDALNAAGFGGFSDWRMPTAKELQSIMHYGTSDPAIQETFFPQTSSSPHWTSGTSQFYTNQSAWTVFLPSGSTNFIFPKLNAYSVRAVRAGKPGLLDESILPIRMTENGDGTITDTATGLVWQQRDDGIQRDWESALRYCETLQLAGYTDWRLPTAKELASVLDMSTHDPAIPAVFSGTRSFHYWSATTDAYIIAGTDPAYKTAWAINFFMGSTESMLKTDNHYVRAVRSSGSGPNEEPAEPMLFSGSLAADVSSGLAPLQVQFDTFIARGIPPFIYQYDFGDGTFPASGDRKETHIYQNPGDYTATVTVTDAAGTARMLQTTILVMDTARIETLTDTLQTKTDQISLVTDGEGISNLLKDSEDITRKTLTAIIGQPDAVKVPVQTSVQTTVEQMVTDTDRRLDTLIQDDKVTAADLVNIASGIGEVVSQMVKTRVPVTTATSENLTAISETIYTQTLDTLLEREQLDQDRLNALKTDRAASRIFFREKPYLLDDIAADTGIQVDTTSDFKADDINARADRHQLTEKQTGLLFNAVEKTLDISGGISSSADISGNTIAQIAEYIYNTYYGKNVVNSSINDITQSLLLEFADSTRISLVVKAVSVVTDFMPAGLFTLPNGNQLGVADTYALEFTAYPAFPHALTAEIIKLDFEPVLTRDSSLRVQVDPSVSLSLKSGYDYVKSNTFDSLITSFRVVGGTNPASEAYALLATYDTGYSQRMPPAIMAMEGLTRVLDTLLPGDYHFDPVTGVLSLGGLKLKPDYVFIDTRQIDYGAITAAGGFVIDKLAFEPVDVNNDGLLDIILHSDNPMGRQVLYSVKE